MTDTPLPPGTGQIGELAAVFERELSEGAQAGTATEDDLHVFTYEHENRLLRGPWESPGSPGAYAYNCVFGRRCMGMHRELQGHAESGGLVLAESMTPEELVAFQERGAHPNVRRPCILCIRANVTEHYLRLRRRRLEGGGPPPPPPPYVINFYVNPTDEAGAYAGSACVPFAEDGDAWLGVVGRVAMFSLRHLRLTQGEDRVWRVDQSRMLHGPQGFDEDAALGAPPSTADGVLRRFLSRRPDICDVLDEPPERRVARLEEVARSYGMSFGDSLALAISCAQNAAFNEAAPDWTTLRHLDTAVLKAASTSCGTLTKARGKKAERQKSRLEPLWALFVRVLDVNGSMRVVADMASKAVQDASSRPLLVDMLRCGLLGAFPGCGRRPQLSVRQRIVLASDAEICALATALPVDVPLVWCCLSELFAVVSEPVTPSLKTAFPYEAWKVRTARVASFMDEVRESLAHRWPEGQTLVAAIGAGALGDALRRNHRRNPRAPRKAQNAAAAGATGQAFMVRVDIPRGAVERQFRALARRGGLFATGNCTVMSCKCCKKTKNFVVSPGLSTASRACGYIEVFAPSPLDVDPRPYCDGTPACAATPVDMISIISPDRTGGAVVVGQEAVIVSFCCGALCTSTALRPSASGVWRCEACHPSAGN